MNDIADQPSPETSRRRFLAGVGLSTAALATGTAWPSTAAAARRAAPNIVLVVGDDVGYGELGAYGQNTIQTPRIDRLAADGVRFTDCYAGGPVCAPARCAMLTGLHTGHCTVRENPAGVLERSALRPEDATFGEILQSVGYRTACIGKWGFGIEEPDQPSHPNERGFEEFFGYISHTHAHDYYPTYLFDNAERVTYPENDGADATYAPELFLNRALDFLERSKDEPFLLFFNPNLPHFPHSIPDQAPYEDRPWTEGNKGHAAQVTLLDNHVGQLVDKLTELGLAENTIVLFIGDNGPHEEGGKAYDPDFFDANGPLRGYKRNLYEGGIRVPAIAWSAGVLNRRPGIVESTPWAFWDLLPTLGDLAGAPVPEHIDGNSVRGLLTGGDVVASPMYFYRRDRYALRHSNAADNGRGLDACEAVRDGRWKAVRFAPGRDRYVADDRWHVELYDLRSDIGETTSVAATHPEMTDRLVRFMRRSWADDPYDRPTWTPYGLSVDPPAYLVAGKATLVETVFTNHRETSYADLRIALDVPSGWRATAQTRSAFDVLRPGRSVRVHWRVEPPAGAEVGVDSHTLTARAAYRYAGRRGRTELDGPVTVAPPAPKGEHYLSDLPWFYALNGYGPVERDMSNGPDGQGDGAPISIRGNTYTKGLGTYAEADIRFHLGGAARRFVSDVGLDDHAADRSDLGSVRFYVFGDGRRLFDSGVLTGDHDPVTVNVGVRNVDVLRLLTTNANDTAFDHASWGGARITT